jgi:hypothetical protein
VSATSIPESWALFSVDIVEAPTEAHPDHYVMWAGTNDPGLNERICQALLYAGGLAGLNDSEFVLSGVHGIFFVIRPEIYEHEAATHELGTALAELAQSVAEKLGRRCDVAEPGAFSPSFMFRAAQARIAVVLGHGQEEEEEEEEEA